MSGLVGTTQAINDINSALEEEFKVIIKNDPWCTKEIRNRLQSNDHYKEAIAEKYKDTLKKVCNEILLDKYNFKSFKIGCLTPYNYKSISNYVIAIQETYAGNAKYLINIDRPWNYTFKVNSFNKQPLISKFVDKRNRIHVVRSDAMYKSYRYCGEKTFYKYMLENVFYAEIKTVFAGEIQLDNAINFIKNELKNIFRSFGDNIVIKVGEIKYYNESSLKIGIKDPNTNATVDLHVPFEYMCLKEIIDPYNVSIDDKYNALFNKMISDMVINIDRGGVIHLEGDLLRDNTRQILNWTKAYYNFLNYLILDDDNYNKLYDCIRKVAAMIVDEAIRVDPSYNLTYYSHLLFTDKSIFIDDILTMMKYKHDIDTIISHMIVDSTVS